MGGNWLCCRVRHTHPLLTISKVNYDVMFLETVTYMYMSTALVYQYQWPPISDRQSLFLNTNNDSHVQSMIVILECIVSGDYTG